MSPHTPTHPKPTQTPLVVPKAHSLLQTPHSCPQAPFAMPNQCVHPVPALLATPTPFMTPQTPFMMLNECSASCTLTSPVPSFPPLPKTLGYVYEKMY